MQIILQNKTTKQVNEKKIREIVSNVTREELQSLPDGALNIVLTDDDEIQRINNLYRGKNHPTDILTFEYGIDQDVLGDMMISLETVERQAPDFENTFEEELLYIIIHGVLHLLGYEHKETDDVSSEQMIMKQSEYFARYVKEC
ncbi:MAG TPA: rRNA maturation RNase YbeY [Kosmotogaceae bacterium]|nr:MAG: Endoribonuclease YbeY [Thermotogales bacterium 46_20]HAA85700.1 rRNA maturation RNase YbeY [Kosmotogaceae bacterium]